MSFYRKRNIFINLSKLFAVAVFLFAINFSKVAFANAERMRCNFNSECRKGFVCIGGAGIQGDSGAKLGCCEIILPLRQVCLFHNLLTGAVGRGIVALVVISMGLAGIFGKLGYKTLITFFAGTVMIFGSYQVVYLLTGWKYQMCELVDTSTPPGKCSNQYDEVTITNGYIE